MKVINRQQIQNIPGGNSTEQSLRDINKKITVATGVYVGVEIARGILFIGLARPNQLNENLFMVAGELAGAIIGASIATSYFATPSQAPAAQ